MRALGRSQLRSAATEQIEDSLARYTVRQTAAPKQQLAVGKTASKGTS